MLQRCLAVHDAASTTRPARPLAYAHRLAQMASAEPEARNAFCRRADLSNETSVEQFFVNRLLEDLGYEDRQVHPKTSLQELHVNLGRRRLLYRPDYALEVARSIRWIIDAKAVDESLDDYVGQCAGYCLALNRAYESNPVQYYLLTNGLTSRLYQWDREEPLLELTFADFTSASAKYDKFRKLVSPQAFTRGASDADSEGRFTLTREPIEEVNAAFTWCHQFIYRKDNLSQAAAFSEFLKIAQSS